MCMCVRMARPGAALSANATSPPQAPSLLSVAFISSFFSARNEPAAPEGAGTAPTWRNKRTEEESERERGVTQNSELA